MQTQQLDPGNARTVYVVQVDHNKDLSDARRYGNLRAVFSPLRKPYDTPALLAKARHVLQGWQTGDYLLMLGDPALCAVCMAVVAEHNNPVSVLSWDRNTFQYAKQVWDFDGVEFDLSADPEEFSS
jgi:hypothetical protein